MKRTATTLIAALMALILTACGGDETPATRTGPQQEPAAASGQAQPNAVLPTRPQRIESLLTPTPEPTERAAPGSSETAATPAEQQPTAETGTMVRNQPDTGTADSLIPENPQLTDEVLLQDIYEQIDLSQFALDPREPIPFREEVSHHYRDETSMKLDFAEARANPFLHVFPMLEETLRIQEKDAEYLYHSLGDGVSAVVHPNLRLGGITRLPTGADRAMDLVYFIPRDPATYFLHHPWFEPIPTGHFSTTRKDQVIIGGHPDAKLAIFPRGRFYEDQRFHALGPQWFGENSTRGVLSESVAQALKNAQHPNVRSHSLLWEEGGRTWEWKERNWDLDDYLRTTLSPPANSSDSSELDRPELFLRYSPSDESYGIPELAQAYPGGPVYQTPWTYWELAHPRLPIVHVTSYQETILPLSHPGQESADLRPTRFAVSFVIAFQNRWTSFQDPNRWLARFPESYQPLEGERWEDLPTRWAEKEGGIYHNLNGVMGMINPQVHESFPNYWHSSDYMQHSLIGPVVVQVYESEVIEPGIYPMTPKVTRWEAPGPIAPDEHLTVYHGMYLPFAQVPGKPNANWPLPGHVATNGLTAPGTDIWNEAGMDYWDW